MASAIKEAVMDLEWEVLHPAYSADIAPVYVTRLGRPALRQPQEIPRMDRSLIIVTLLISARNQFLIRILSVSTAMLVVCYLDGSLPAFLNRNTGSLSGGRAHVPPRPILVSRVGWLRVPSKLRSDDSQWILNQTLPDDWIVRICPVVSIRAWTADIIASASTQGGEFVFACHCCRGFWISDCFAI